jgi:hypothetical protein
LIIGTETGKINEYAYVPSAVEQPFVLITEDHGNISEGQRAAIHMIDLNNDQRDDLLVGNWGGGLAVYYSETSQVVNEYHEYKLSISPNPSNGLLRINNYDGHEFFRYKISDSVGNILQSGAVINNLIDLTHHQLSTGIYFITLSGTNGKHVTRPVVIKTQ